jgi:hypothetical protein
VNDIELIKNELTVQGIKSIGNNTFIVSDGMQQKEMQAEQVFSFLNASIKRHKTLFFDIWKDLASALQGYSVGNGNETTQRIFANSLKVILHQTQVFPVLKIYKPIVLGCMSQDSARFSERFMSDVIDSQIGLEWLRHLVCVDRFRISLLRAYAKEQTAKSVIAADISGVQGPWSNFDLPMGERMWSYKTDDEENFDESTRNKQDGQRYRMQETYNDPYRFEEGFFYRDVKNDPFDYDDREEESPYPTSGQPFSRP